MSKAVAKKETKQDLVVAPQFEGGVGEEEILSSNIVIPKVLLMQGLSEAVSEGVARMGDMVRSTNYEKVGGPDAPVEFVPLTYTTTWILQEKVGAAWEYRGQEPMTASNQDLPWTFEQNGTEWKRTKSLNLYALLVKDIEAEKAEMKKAQEEGEIPDPDKALMPVLISFRSTSFPAGKSIVTHFAKARKFNAPGYVSILKLKCRKDKNDLGTFYVYEVESAGKTPKEYYEPAQYWRMLVTANKVEVDESDETGRGASVSEDEENAQF